MLARVWSVVNVGLKSVLVEVEVDVASAGFPDFAIVGLADKAVNEAKDRVKTAINNSGMEFPVKKITVNLAPADLPKMGAAFDLPIAVGVMTASGMVPDSLDGKIFFGELGLDGGVRHTRGGLLVAIMAREQKFEEIFLPIESANQAAVVDEIKVMPVRSLQQWVRHVRGEKMIEPLEKLEINELLRDSVADFDMGEIVGQETAKRAIIIAAAGGHNLLMVGPPGTGKTMLARALPGILPRLSDEESLLVSKIYSIAGLMEPGEAVIRRRPFRSPHHSISMAGLVGGGSKLTPGEAVLAHLGVLFLDELAEFSRLSLEALRQPMEDGKVEIVRVAGRVEYPASFQLVAAVNPCPCGYQGHPTKECTCGQGLIDRYKKRISGPIIDRIDMQINVAPVESVRLVEMGSKNMTNEKNQNNYPKSEEIRKKVSEVRLVQNERLKNDGIFCNAQMRNKQVSKYCVLNGESKRLLQIAIDKYDMSARGYYRLLKVARTIADMAGEADIKTEHVAEALMYRERVF